MDQKTGNTWSAVPAPPPITYDFKGRPRPPEQRLVDLLAARDLRDSHELCVHGGVYIVPEQVDYKTPFGGKRRVTIKRRGKHDE